MSLWPFYTVLVIAFAYCVYRFVKAIIVNHRDVKDQKERIELYKQGLMTSSDLLAGNSKMLRSNADVMVWILAILGINLVFTLIRLFA